MKSKVYLETTIPSYLAGWLSRDLLTAAHQEVTREWWERRRQSFDLYVSEMVIEECGAGDAVLARRRLALVEDLPILVLTPGAQVLAEQLLAGGPIPRKAAGDALHIALATVYGCEYLLTWNCRHIANAEIQRAARLVVAGQGYDLPTICTPEELMEECHGLEG